MLFTAGINQMHIRRKLNKTPQFRLNRLVLVLCHLLKFVNGQNHRTIQLIEIGKNFRQRLRRVIHRP